MTTITLQDAQANLAELVHQLTPGEEVVITENDQPVALIIASQTPATKSRQPGTLRGTVLHMADDFDAPLDEADLDEWEGR